MKSRLSFIVTNLFALLVLFLPQVSPAQSDTPTQHRHTPRYKAVDIGTFGGRASYVNPAWELGGPNQMNRHGSTVGTAATEIPASENCPLL
jgi:hypothetical protein